MSTASDWTTYGNNPVELRHRKMQSWQDAVLAHKRLNQRLPDSVSSPDTEQDYRVIGQCECCRIPLSVECDFDKDEDGVNVCRACVVLERAEVAAWNSRRGR